MMLWSKTVLGEPASKANSRRLVYSRGVLRSIKSEKALRYASDFAAQVQTPAKPILGELAMTCRIFYCSQRSDLDASLIMDLLQKCGVIKNDRQLRQINLYHGIDKQNPRAEIELTERKK